MPWPEHLDTRLEFLARLSLSELQEAGPVDWLPASGALLFFYDVEGEAWGFDPEDRGGAVVLHVPDLAEPEPGDAVDGGESSVARCNIAFRPIRVLPSCERPEIAALGLSDAESEACFDLAQAAFAAEPLHQVAGLPMPVQGDDMELECQLVTHGLYCGDPHGYHDPRVAALSAGAANWRLLLQFDSDDELGVMWGDAGMIYFWVEEARARVGDFSNVWLVLQCH